MKKLSDRAEVYQLLSDLPHFSPDDRDSKVLWNFSNILHSTSTQNLPWATQPNLTASYITTPQNRDKPQRRLSSWRRHKSSRKAKTDQWLTYDTMLANQHRRRDAESSRVYPQDNMQNNAGKSRPSVATPVVPTDHRIPNEAKRILGSHCDTTPASVRWALSDS
jgi:hypothetical protein